MERLRATLAFGVMFIFANAVDAIAAEPSVISSAPTTVPAPAPIKTGLNLKRRIAVGRFSNATQYGRALLLPGERDPLADQAADMLVARLVESGEFIVLERRDLSSVKKEQALVGGAVAVGADTVLVGSVTQFGRQTEGKTGFLTHKARQVASATVEVRLVDSRTGQAFFSTSGSGTSEVEVGNFAGFGSQAAYDSSLNDKAISAAISDLMTNVINNLKQKPWSTDILSVSGSDVMISGGLAQGLKVGDQLQVTRRGKVIISRQTGLPIELPGDAVGTIQIISFFGAGDAEGSRARILTGQVSASDVDLIVTSKEQ